MFYFSGISLEEGLCHEMGHALGMGHTSVPKSIMLPSIPGLTTDVILSSDDIAGIQNIYGGPNGEVSLLNHSIYTSSCNM